MASTRDVGRPWPGATHGEVVGPAGTRSYVASSAAERLGWSERRVRAWGNSGRLKTDAGDPSQRPNIFFDAEEVEALLNEARRPQTLVTPESQEVAALRQELAEAEASIDDLVAANRHLAHALERLRSQTLR